MKALSDIWREYRDVVGAFSRPARRLLLLAFLVWVGNGIYQVIYNLYLVAGGYQEGFVGRVIATNGVGLALCALPAGLLADRWGRKRTLVAGACVESLSLLVRAVTLAAAPLYVASFLAGAGQAMIAVASAPFLAEHSTTRERTHLFSAYFATAVLAGVVGSLIAGGVPTGLLALPEAFHPGELLAYRIVLGLGAVIVAAAMLAMRGVRDSDRIESPESTRPVTPADRRALLPFAVTAFTIGMGAGLVIPFMNLYFATRFQCSAGQIGVFFSTAQIITAAAMLLAPLAARRFGQLGTATVFQLASIPFLVTLGFERRLSIAVGAFWARAALMQGSNPLVHAFAMDTLPPALRARTTSINNTVWNVGWAVSAGAAGLVIERFGYAMPFYVTAFLYATATIYLYASFRNVKPATAHAVVPEEAKGQRGEGPFTE